MIDNTAFISCGALMINVDDGNNNYSSIDGFLFNKTQTRIIAYAKDRLQPNYTIPEGVTSIYESVFNGCSSPVSIVIPKGVTEIGSTAFYKCSLLTSIMIPEGVTYIGRAAFSGCSSLTSITIPEGVTNINDSVFYNCSSLSSIVIPASVTSINDNSFTLCKSLMTITCNGITAPNCTYYTFGDRFPDYTGSNTYNTGENKLYVPANATGYEESYWLTTLCNSSKCGFTLSKTL